jgi:hypothetical protein
MLVECNPCAQPIDIHFWSHSDGTTSSSPRAFEALVTKSSHGEWGFLIDDNILSEYLHFRTDQERLPLPLPRAAAAVPSSHPSFPCRLDPCPAMCQNRLVTDKHQTIVLADQKFP